MRDAQPASVELLEKLFDSPEWLKIHSFQLAGRRGELVLQLRGKKYWFPVTERAYKRFTFLAVKESRGVGLRYLQRYVRQFKEYRGRWNTSYYRKHAMPRKGKVVTIKKRGGGTVQRKAASYRTVFGSKRRHSPSFGEAIVNQDLIHNIASQTGLTQAQASQVLNLLQQGEANESISATVGVTATHVGMARKVYTRDDDRLVEQSIEALLRGAPVGEVIDSLTGGAS